MTPYSNDLREKIIQFFENHPDDTQQEIADEFGVSCSFIEKLLQRWRATGSSAALPHGGGQAHRLKDHGEKIRELVASQPDITLDELRTQLIVAFSLEGLQAPWVLEGALNGEIFKFYVGEVLAPTLKPGDILVMDNLSTHKVAGIAELVEARGARFPYLSPYSPDDNPIERCGSKIKTYLRRAKARTDAALVRAIKKALATIKESDMRAWFIFCGYSIR